MAKSNRLTGTEIRRMFLDYFAGHGHALVPSSPLIPAGDKTLLFVNAGMVQFKQVFQGTEKRAYVRAASSQKCLRVSGKHNDLESVGRTARHHTFFEMLGNFSFGDYFKHDAIRYGWEFITETVGLPKDELWITVYKDDDEAAKIWETEIGIPPARILRLGEKDNFWSMGPVGPCGPCSEIHIDRGDKYKCPNPNCGPDCDCDRFLELWNLVFMQYNREEDGTLNPLPKPSVDTGMGLERITSVVQGVDTNYDTDLFLPIIRAVESFVPGGLKYPGNDKANVSYRVIGDHARAVAFIISDGIIPSNEGRGYVLRRILRRALRHGKLLGIERPFLHEVVPAVADIMRGQYPELDKNMKSIVRVVRTEEERFIHTLVRGLDVLNEIIAKTSKSGASVIPGDDAFKLYDTYGFPLDLAVEVAQDASMSIDMPGFESAMEKQKELARASWKEGESAQVAELWAGVMAKTGATRFVGYETESAEAKVTAIIQNGAPVTTANKGDEADLLLDITPFYAESGGQTGDIGIIKSAGAAIEVTGTNAPVKGIYVHKCIVRSGSVSVGESVLAEVDTNSRTAIRRNHSATHLLHASLRQVLGEHVKQAGSLVEQGRLRFDFTHFSGLTAEETGLVERMVNREIMTNAKVNTDVLAYDEAVSRGAMALFGEKYGDTVRMVSISDFSTELCGGTHVSHSGDIGPFKIVSEGSVAAGVRRIEAFTGDAAYERIQSDLNLLSELRGALKAAPGEELAKLERFQKSTRELEKQVEKLRLREISGAGSSSGETGSTPGETSTDIAGITVTTRLFDAMDSKILREYVDRLKSQGGKGVYAAGSAPDGKVTIIIGVTADLVPGVHAGKILGEIAPIVGGKGGGRPDFAQGGGKEPAKLEEALAKIPEIVRSMSGK